jgi:hypothetical protein
MLGTNNAEQKLMNTQTPRLRGTFNLPTGEVTRQQFAEMLALKHRTDIKTALKLIGCCEREDEIDEDSPKNYWELLEEACQLIAYSDGDVDELPVELVKQVSAEGTEQSILDSALSSRLDNSYSRLSERFDFGEFMTQFKPKDGTIPTPEDYAAAIGMGVDMSSKGMWLAGDGISNLIRMGHENVVYQIAASLKMSYSAVSNWHRTAQRIPLHYRHEISPTVAVEIATAKFSEDESENNAKIKELINQAREEKWSCAEARAHVRMEKGQEPLQKLAKSDTKWLAEFGGAEELLIIATKCAMCQAGVASYHFAVTLVKIFHQLTEKTQIVLKEYLKERMDEETFDEDTNDELRRIVK